MTSSSPGRIDAVTSQLLQASEAGGGPLPAGRYDRGFFVVLPRVASKSNFRAGDGNWMRFASFEEHAGWLMLKHRPSGWDVGTKDEELKRRPVVVCAIAARTLIDAANLTKSVPDAAEGPVVVNDASIRYVSGYAERVKADQRGLVAFAQLPADADRDAVFDAAADLHEHMRTLTSTF